MCHKSLTSCYREYLLLCIMSRSKKKGKAKYSEADFEAFLKEVKAISLFLV